MRQAVGFSGDDRGLDRKLFGVSPLPAGFQDAEHRIADFQIVDAGARGGDRPGEIPAQHQGRFGLRILGAAHFPIGAVDARGHHVDDDLAGCRHRVRQVAVLQDFRTAKLLDVGRFHGVSPRTRRAPLLG